jgi:hypothetical protein
LDLAAEIADIDLAVLAQEYGGVFEQASGVCQGRLEARWDAPGRLKARARFECPRPGGKIHAKFLRNLADWMPEGAARRVVEEEVARADNYYYDSAVLEIHNQTPGFWTVYSRLNNPRLKLEVPVDISETSLGVLWNNTELQKLLKKWSETQ